MQSITSPRCPRGITPAEVFRLLGSSSIYGQSAVEARYISREIDIFGRDLIDALRLVSSRYSQRPHERIFTGHHGKCCKRGEHHGLFQDKSRAVCTGKQADPENVLRNLALVSESYVTAMVAGTLFLIILQSIMSVLSGDNKPMFLYAVIYVMIPLGSVMFVIMISSMTPES